MKIKGKVWMDWLHQVRKETLEERKREGSTLSQHLRIIEGREGKTVKFNQSGAAKLPNDKPVVYKIQTESGNTNYVGIAKRGRVQERIQEHLDAGKIPGAKVQIQQMSSIQGGGEN